MNLRHAAWLVCGVASLGAFAYSGSRAQPALPEHAQPALPEQMTTADVRVISLTVRDVDHATHRVTFEARVSPDLQVFKNGEVVALDQLHEGDTLALAFDKVTGDVVRAEVVSRAP